MQYVNQFKSEFLIHNVIFNKQSHSDNQTKGNNLQKCAGIYAGMKR